MIQTGDTDIQTQVDALSAVLQAHIGNDYSAPVQGAAHPAQLLIYQHVHGPYRQSVDGTHTGTFYMEFDSDVRQLYKSKLTFRLNKVRSNVSATSLVAAGSQNPTSSSGGSSTPTTSSGGSQTPTSSSGGSTSPTSSDNLQSGTSSTAQVLGVNGSSANTGSSGTGATGNSNNSTSHAHSSPAGNWSIDTGNLTNGNNVDAHTHNGPSHTHTQNYSTVDALTGFTMTHNHTVTIGNHTHSVTINDHSHTVTIAAHTHTVTIADHIHTVTMTYGIYEGPAPSTPAITLTINGVDVTSALGGPWNVGATVDITSYMRDHTLQPHYQANTIVFGSSELLDIEFEARSLCATASPLGLTL